MIEPDSYFAGDEQPQVTCNPTAEEAPPAELPRELPTQQAAEFASDQLALLVEPAPGKT